MTIIVEFDLAIKIFSDCVIDCLKREGTLL